MFDSLQIANKLIFHHKLYNWPRRKNGDTCRPLNKNLEYVEHEPEWLTTKWKTR